MEEDRGSGPRPEKRREQQDGRGEASSGNRGGRGRRFGRRRQGRGKPGERPQGEKPQPNAEAAQPPADQAREGRGRDERGREGRGDQRPEQRPSDREERGRGQGRDNRDNRDNRPESRPALRPERPERREEPAPAEPAERIEPPLCPLCQKPVIDLSTAIGADRESGQPAHFDCVLDRVAAAENLGPKERLVYLGSGAFAVVEGERPEGAFTVKRRVQWEKEGEKKDWRRALSSRITKI